MCDGDSGAGGASQTIKAPQVAIDDPDSWKFTWLDNKPAWHNIKTGAWVYPSGQGDMSVPAPPRQAAPTPQPVVQVTVPDSVDWFTPVSQPATQAAASAQVDWTPPAPQRAVKASPTTKKKTAIKAPELPTYKPAVSTPASATTWFTPKGVVQQTANVPTAVKVVGGLAMAGAAIGIFWLIARRP